MPIRVFDREVFARTLYMEGRGQSQDALIAKAWSMLNRHLAKRWYSGATLAECCMMPWQFSCWNMDAGADRRAGINVLSSAPVMAEIIHLMDLVIGDEVPDPTQGATHYFDEPLPTPSWAAPPAVFTVQIGTTRFYKGVA